MGAVVIVIGSTDDVDVAVDVDVDDVGDACARELDCLPRKTASQSLT